VGALGTWYYNWENEQEEIQKQKNVDQWMPPQPNLNNTKRQRKTFAFLYIKNYNWSLQNKKCLMSDVLILIL